MIAAKLAAGRKQDLADVEAVRKAAAVVAQAKPGKLKKKKP